MKDKTILTTDQIRELVMGSLYKTFESEINSTWSNPIREIIKEVINENYQPIKNEFQSALDESLNDSEFKKIVREEFKRKVAKNLVGKLEGEVEKAVNAIRQDQTMRARMILAIEKIVNEG